MSGPEREREGEGGVVERRREAVVKAEAEGRRHKGGPCQEAVGLEKTGAA